MDPAPDQQVDPEDEAIDVVYAIPAAETLDPVDALAERVATARRDSAILLSKSVHFVAALFLFILAIQLMKTGAKAIGPTIQGSFPFDNGVSTLGFG